MDAARISRPSTCTPSPGTNRPLAITAPSAAGTAAEPKKLTPLLPLSRLSRKRSSGKPAPADALGLCHFERDSARVTSPEATASACWRCCFACHTPVDPQPKGTACEVRPLRATICGAERVRVLPTPDSCSAASRICGGEVVRAPFTDFPAPLCCAMVRTVHPCHRPGRSPSSRRYWCQIGTS